MLLGNKKGKAGTSNDNYKHTLQLYNLPPTGILSLQDFDKLSLARLKVLKTVDSAGLRAIKGSKDYHDLLLTELRNLKMEELQTVVNPVKSDKFGLQGAVLQGVDNDIKSHYILRLAYCRTEQLRRWFIQQEVDLFRFRLTSLPLTMFPDFLKENNLDYEPIDQENLDKVADKVAAASGPDFLASATHYYMVPFEDVCDLVKSRRVYLNQGFAYVPQPELSVLLCNIFRRKLSEDLTRACHKLPKIEEDTRLMPLLTNLSKTYLGRDYSNTNASPGEVTADMIDMLSVQSFPLCMQQLHQALTQNHHLKHMGRLQYGLFLKGIGLTLEEALKFWKREFIKGQNEAKFQKEYSYNIRHSYGKEGRKTSYTPYSCVKIITTNHPATGDHHGCPFRHTEPSLLRQRLLAQRLPKDGVDEVMKCVETGNYQIACARVFELKHDGFKGSVHIDHPNHYYEQSRQILIEGPSKPKGVSLVKVTPKENEEKSQTMDTSDCGQLTPDQQAQLFGEYD